MSIIVPGRLGLFIGKAVAFFTGPLGKLAAYAFLAVSLLYGGRLWLNKHDDKVARETYDKVKQGLESQYVGQWQKALSEAKTMSDDAKVKYEAADELNRRIDMKFAQVFTSLSQIRAEVKERQVVYVKEAAAVPDAQLDDALRVLSGIIAAQAPHR